jgi:hypothetical protein
MKAYVISNALCMTILVGLAAYCLDVTMSHFAPWEKVMLVVRYEAAQNHLLWKKTRHGARGHLVPWAMASKQH